MNRPVESVPSAETDTIEQELPQSIDSNIPIQSVKADCPITISSNKYYEVLTPSQDELVFISHADIMNSRCIVQLAKLDKDTIKSLPADVPAPPLQTSSTESIDSHTPKKKPCYRPKRKPSKARVRAQQIITSRKKNKQTTVPQSHILPPAKSKQPHGEMKAVIEDAEITAHDSFDDTIIYTLPVSPKRKINKKHVAKLIIRTVGLKTHHDTAAVIACNKKRLRNFKCYLCGESFTSTQSLNTHFRINHEGLDCIECDKAFNSLLSLKKHSYIHKLCTLKCSRCEKMFPFKSQRDFHKKVHDNLCFTCTRELCDSSFSQEGDLRQHME